MDDFRECWQTMPDEDLREVYRSRLKAHKRLGTIAFAPLIPALVIYGFMGWTGFFALEMSGFRGGMGISVGGAFYYVALAVSSGLIRTVSLKRRWEIFIPPAVTVPLVALLFGNISPDISAIFGYLLYAYFKLGKLIPDLEFLRGLPRFPFDNHGTVRDVRIMNAKAAEQYLDTSAGKVVAVDYERIFTAERPEEIVSPPENKGEYFQQHKISYKNGKKGELT